MKDSVRIDRWLSAARIFKSRTHAQQACIGGHVRVNGGNAKPSHPVRVSDKVEASAPRGRVILEILLLAEKRLSPPKARELYDDQSPPPPPREPALPMAERARGAGRPTKRDRRALIRLRRD